MPLTPLEAQHSSNTGANVSKQKPDNFKQTKSTSFTGQSGENDLLVPTVKSYTPGIILTVEETEIVPNWIYPSLPTIDLANANFIVFEDAGQDNIQFEIHSGNVMPLGSETVAILDLERREATLYRFEQGRWLQTGKPMMPYHRLGGNNMQFSYDRIGFPLIVVPDVGIEMHLLPVTKVQFERFIAEPNKFDSTGMSKF